jgi:hypothetical protein
VLEDVVYLVNFVLGPNTRGVDVLQVFLGNVLGAEAGTMEEEVVRPEEVALVLLICFI